MEKRIKKGFTLIEVLIAATIFATVMVMVVGIFSWASSYNAKLREMRKVNYNARKTMSMISDDIRQANGRVRFNNSVAPGGFIEIGEYAIVNCSTNYINSCNIQQQYKNSPDVAIDFESNYNNGLIIVNKRDNKIIFYRLLREDQYRGDLKRYEVDLGGFSGNISSLETPEGESLINDPSLDFELAFAGYTPETTNRNQQPFIKIMMKVESEGYDELTVGYRSRIELQSSVTSRYYDIYE